MNNTYNNNYTNAIHRVKYTIILNYNGHRVYYCALCIGTVELNIFDVLSKLHHFRRYIHIAWLQLWFIFVPRTLGVSKIKPNYFRQKIKLTSHWPPNPPIHHKFSWQSICNSLRIKLYNLCLFLCHIHKLTVSVSVKLAISVNLRYNFDWWTYKFQKSTYNFSSKNCQNKYE